MNGLGKEFDKFLKDYIPPKKGMSNRDMLRDQDLYVKFTAFRVTELETKLEDYNGIRKVVVNIVRSMWVFGTAVLGAVLFTLRDPIMKLGEYLSKIFGG